MRVRAALIAVLMAVSVSSCSRLTPAAHPAAPPRPAPVSAQAVRPDPRVGAVFVGSGSLHSCTAAVLDSPGGDLILTAAHCLVEGADTMFVPAFNNSAAPQDVWHVGAVYLDPRWIRGQDPTADFAIARVGRDAGGSVEAQTGGGLQLGREPKPGTTVTVTGYGEGVGGGPIACRAPTAATRDGFPSLPCAGLVDGLSGAPWMTGSTVEGVIGGLHGGGCNDDVSYSPPFDGQIAALLARAGTGGPGDAAPSAPDGDC
jgi:hypothetical protein